MTAPVYDTAGRKGAYATVTASGSLSVDKPDNVAEGDLLWLNIHTFTQVTAGLSRIASVPSGFTVLRSELTSATTGAPEAIVAYKVAGASEPATYSVSVTAEGSTSTGLVIGRITGFDAENIISASSGTNTGDVPQNTFTLPSITAANNDSLHLAFASCRNGASANTLSWTNFTETSVLGSTGFDSGQERLISGAETVAAGATITPIAQLANAGAERWAGIVAVINPATEAARYVPDISALYYQSQLLANKTGIKWTLRAGHTDLDGELIASGTAGTTDDNGLLTMFTGTYGTLNENVTLSLYWEEGSDLVADRSLIVQTTLVAAT